MIIEVKVPSVGESVTSGVVSAWHKKSGEFVNEGEPLFALETDKVSTDIVAEKSGMLETKVPEGQEVKIGEVVAVIDDSKQRSARKQGREASGKKEGSLRNGKTSRNLRKKPSRSGCQARELNVARRSHQLRLQCFRLQFVALWRKRSSNRRKFAAPAKADV